MPHQVNGSQRVGGGHVWPCPLDSPYGMLGLTKVIPTGGFRVCQCLADDVLKVGVHAVMRARLRAKRKPRREGGAKSKPIEDRRLHRQELIRRSL